MKVTFLHKIIHAPFVGFKWVSALEKSAHNDFQGASKDLEYLARFFENKDIEFHLLRGRLRYILEKNDESFKDVEMAIKLMKKSTRYNEMEKMYLACYAANIMDLIDQERNPDGDKISRQKTLLEFIDLGKVGIHLKKNFPLKHHPFWNE